MIPVGGCGSAGGRGSADPVTSTSLETDESPLLPSAASTSSRQRATKTVSKVASIKKILNKKIKLNSHVKFDEKGEELQVDTPTSTRRYKDLDDTDDDDDVSDTATSIVPISIAAFESLQRSGGGEGRTVGGIKISDAQRRIRARDKIDRKFERERIRALHRERRLKRKKQGKPVDGDGDEGTSTTALLAMADSDSDAASSASSDEDSDKDYAQPGGRKRRRKGGEGQGGGKKRRSEEQLGASVDPELADDEQLAKHLLGI